MKYKFSNHEFTQIKNDRKTTGAFCDVCGKPHKNGFGFEIEYEMYDSYCRNRMKLCRKCAEQIIPRLEQAVEECHKMRYDIQNRLTERVNCYGAYPTLDLRRT